MSGLQKRKDLCFRFRTGAELNVTIRACEPAEADLLKLRVAAHIRTAIGHKVGINS